jgi:IS5 family transposase
MSHLLAFADNEFNSKRCKTRKKLFLSRMNKLMPWDQLEAVNEPLYSKLGMAYLLSTMFRIHCMQDWYK